MKRLLTVLALACLAASLALSQGAGSGLDRSNRGGAGAPGGMKPGGMFRVSRLMLISLSAVQDELKLSKEQRTKIDEVLAKAKEARSGVDRPGAGGFNEQPYVAEIESILTPEQRTRLAQIQLWVIGAPALASDEVARRVGLTQSQIEQIRGVLREFAATLRSEAKEGGADRQSLRDRMQRLRAELDAKILALLTPEQIERWNKLRGPKFELPEKVKR